jgi:hypothetical protein
MVDDFSGAKPAKPGGTAFDRLRGRLSYRPGSAGGSSLHALEAGRIAAAQDAAAFSFGTKGGTRDSACKGLGDR